MTLNFKQLLKQIKLIALDIDGVLTNGQLLVTPEGDLLRSMNIKDGYAMKKAVESGVKIFIISGSNSKGVTQRLNGLGITEIHLGVADKKSLMLSLCDKYKISTSEVLYMGDDIPDLEVMKSVRIACCPADAVAEIKAVSVYQSLQKGGEGCVRDVIEQVLRIQGYWNQ
ncbi:MAG TPA: HAD hydrolase family protein [Bacteroidia bacterium]|nr:HAD hydrolase family protein [Bacteroidia bacterium]HNT81055.1 HAD hydrolase family protein [Bacteroidia bacterium]